MSPKIVINGREFDGVESMPDDVRRQYEAALNALSPEERRKLELVGHIGHLRFNVEVHRKFKIDGKEYESPEQMPADVRAKYEDAVAMNPSLRDTATTLPKASSGALPAPPPAMDAGEDRRGALYRVLLWVAAGAAILIWLLSRR